MDIAQYFQGKHKQSVTAFLLGGLALFLLAIGALYLENRLLLKLRIEPFWLRGCILLTLFLIFPLIRRIFPYEPEEFIEFTRASSRNARHNELPLMLLIILICIAPFSLHTGWQLLSKAWTLLLLSRETGIRVLAFLYAEEYRRPLQEVEDFAMVRADFFLPALLALDAVRISHSEKDDTKETFLSLSGNWREAFLNDEDEE